MHPIFSGHIAEALPAASQRIMQLRIVFGRADGKDRCRTPEPLGQSRMPTTPVTQKTDTAIPLVQLARVLEGATPFKNGNVNDTYRGLISTTNGDRTAFIKDLEPKELANEVLGAALALQLGLPVPPPYLALAHPDRFPAKNGPVFGGGRLVYASVDVAQPQVAVYLKSNESRAVDRLIKWQKLGSLYGFDAFSANVDRHEGNILYSGRFEIWLIDHGCCFTGPNWEKTDFEPADRAVSSRLSTWLTPKLNLAKRNATASDAAVVERDAARIDLRSLANVNHVAELLTEGDLDAVINFLNARIPHIPRLAASALGISRLV